MKKILFSLFLLFSFGEILASHIVGGEVFYTYLGPGTNRNTSRYRISLRLFTDCHQDCGGNTGVACPPDQPFIGIFNNIAPSYTRVQNVRLTKDLSPMIQMTTFPGCLPPPYPEICYSVNTYSTIVQLSNTAEGYRFTYQNCCRRETLNLISDVPNPQPPHDPRPPGAAYEAILPGTNILPRGTNSSAVVDLKDTALVCHGNPFELSFSASDADGDSLSYRFAPAYNGGSFIASFDDSVPDVPLYGTVQYRPGFSGVQPLGTEVTINPITGLISGIAPAVSGDYVINVIVTEWRNGVQIAEHRKDFIVKVEDCDIPSARLTPQDETCDGFTRHFSNLSNNHVTSWYWDFGVSGADDDTSILTSPTYTYQDTGKYNVTLYVNRGTSCVDSSVYTVWVYPGFFPGFNAIAPYCKNVPIQLQDATRTNYGQVLSWRWDFGTTATNDTSHLQNPAFVYTTAGTYHVRLNVSNSYGCSGSIEKDVIVFDPPPLIVRPRDTTYCALDSVQLSATGAGSFAWSPANNILSGNTATPIVFPPAAARYFVTLTDDNGCKSTDSVRVNPVNNVTNSITASATSICAEDTITLTGSSNYSNVTWQWAPESLTLTPTLKITKAFPVSNARFTLTTSWGRCIATATKDITVKPLAVPEAGAGGAICKGQGTLQLQASGGISYQWSPTRGLNNPNVPNPVASPDTTTLYKVAVGVAGCNKTKTDSVLVTVRALPQANLVDDTLICSIDTLQLITNPVPSYVWGPNYMISSLTAASPLVSPDVPTTYYTTLTDAFGCINKDSVFVDVKLFVTIDAGKDTTICRTDTFHLRTVSDALSYQWSPSTWLNADNVKNPVATPLDDAITYHVVGNIGKCQNSDDVTIRTVPYPAVQVNPDTSICFGDNAMLYASGGSSYTWSPATYLNSVNSPNTIAIKPAAGQIRYTVTVTDNKGCPKPVTGTTLVTVRQPVHASTGARDTSIVIGQSIQMNASGGDQYLWEPGTWLSDVNSPRAIARPEKDIVYKLTVTQLPENCIARDSVKIKVFLLPPSFYVPTAFSPNGDGNNDVLKPIALGMKSLKYFKVFNRLGNLVFETTELNKGWDGIYKGNPQDPGTFVWMAQGETYQGEFITRKGTAVLIR